MVAGEVNTLCNLFCNLMCFTFWIARRTIHSINNDGVNQMAKVVKTVRIEESLVEKLAKIADAEFEGNATAALEAFIEQGVALREFSEQERWFIYSKSNSVVHHFSKTERGSFEEANRIRSLTSALWI